MHSRDTLRDRFRGCLLGGAVGDALGAPVEFLQRSEILARFGPEGITRYAPAYGGLGTITDDTQMTLFTADGLIRAWVRGRIKGMSSIRDVTAHAYLRWLETQGERPRARDVGFSDEPGWLIGQTELHHRRAPGTTCLAALREMRHLGELAHNDSKGCGGVMRVAPVGLFAARHTFPADPAETFGLGVELAALTHGHPTGSLAAGVLASVILALVEGMALPDALDVAVAILEAQDDHTETLHAIEAARSLAASDVRPEEAIARLGAGWVAEEALAIALYCALIATDFRHGIILAVNHDGDSDSTGAIAGNLLGAMHGEGAIPPEWLEPLELRDVIATVADDLHDFVEWSVGTDEEADDTTVVWERYPGF